MTALIAILGPVLAGVMGVVVTAILYRRKFHAEVDDLEQNTEDKVYNRLRSQLVDALDRADKAAARADAATARADEAFNRLYAVYDMIERHRPWDHNMVDLMRRVIRLLQEHKFDVSEFIVGDPPELNPYRQHEDEHDDGGHH